MYQVCYTRYRVSFYLSLIGSVLKHCTVPKYYEQGCRHVSSAYKNRSHLTAIGISLRFIKNNKGPRIDPCGTNTRYFTLYFSNFRNVVCLHIFYSA